MKMTDEKWREDYLWLQNEHGVRFECQRAPGVWDRCVAAFSGPSEDYRVYCNDREKAEALLAGRKRQQEDCTYCAGTGDSSGEYPGAACVYCGGTGRTQDDELTRLRAENESLRKNAERYIFARDHDLLECPNCSPDWICEGPHLHGQDAATKDAIIDAAMKGKS